jgi:inorganic pyrophosphatase
MKKDEINAKKQHAEEIYMSSEMTLKEIASIINISENSLGKWAKIGEWEDKKTLKRSSKQQAINNLYTRLLEQSKNTDTSSDEIKKTTSAIKDLEDSRTTIPDKIELFMDFIQYLRKNNVDIEFIKQVNIHQNEMVQEMISNVKG